MWLMHWSLEGDESAEVASVFLRIPVCLKKLTVERGLSRLQEAAHMQTCDIPVCFSMQVVVRVVRQCCSYRVCLAEPTHCLQAQTL